MSNPWGGEFSFSLTRTRTAFRHLHRAKTNHTPLHTYPYSVCGTHMDRGGNVMHHSYAKRIVFMRRIYGANNIWKIKLDRVN